MREVRSKSGVCRRRLVRLNAAELRTGADFINDEVVSDGAEGDNGYDELQKYGASKGCLTYVVGKYWTG